MTEINYQTLSQRHSTFVKVLLLHILAYVFVLSLKGTEYHSYAVWGYLVSLIAAIVFMVRLTVLFTSKIKTFLYVLFALFPGLGTLSLLLASNQATKILKKAGFKLGWFGQIKPQKSASQAS